MPPDKSPSAAGCSTWWLWRHPRPHGVQGRCIGRTEVPVDRRRAKRLAHRIRRVARREGLPRIVWTSPLSRCRQVGECLARWGWMHRVDARLLEVDFGAWDGRLWDDIGAAEVDGWCADFAHHSPGGGESLVDLFERCRQTLASLPVGASMCVVGHGGWMSAACHVAAGRPAPRQAMDWPAPCPYGASRVLSVAVGGGTLPP